MHLYINTLNLKQCICTLEDKKHQLHCFLINFISVGNNAPHINELISEIDLDLLVIELSFHKDRVSARLLYIMLLRNSCTTVVQQLHPRHDVSIC